MCVILVIVMWYIIILYLLLATFSVVFSYSFANYITSMSSLELFAIRTVL